ncbi:acyl-CoA thioesterase [Pararhodobacter sp.]|uniref:acyl-CoA thioesterase n=1 Tax=Pararhodobacter sp. TaxID=2127056 RepID=UPI002FDDA165
MPERLPALPLSAYPYVVETQLQWADSDIYGHLNNVAYLAYFDTALNMALVEHGALDVTPGGEGLIGLVAQSGAQYFAEVTFPSRLRIGVRVEAIGRTSLTWGFGLFAREQTLCAARGNFVHVYVERQTRRPHPLSPPLLACAQALFTDPKNDP